MEVILVDVPHFHAVVGHVIRERELADETDSASGEPVEERPVGRRSETDSYVVEPNDNFWRISQKVYGTGAYFKALEQHNRGRGRIDGFAELHQRQIVDAPTLQRDAAGNARGIDLDPRRCGNRGIAADDGRDRSRLIDDRP